MRRDLRALDGREFDLVVIGGGIQGACLAREAASRGLSVALLERDDFGAATSGNSLGVVHGGLRYLQQADLTRLRESARERAAWLRTAPHLVRPLPVLLPVYPRGGRPRALLAGALALDALLAPDRNRGVPPSRRLPRARLVSRRTARELAPWLDPRLTGGALFFDGRLVHPDRLTWGVVRAAAEAGAAVANQAEARQLLFRGGAVAGVRVRDRVTGGDLTVHARVVANAAGPWAAALAGGPWGSRRAPPLAAAMNAVVTRPLAAAGCAVGVAGPQGRLYFVVPWQDRSAVGTGYRPQEGPPEGARPRAVDVRRFLGDLAPVLGGDPMEEGEVTRVLWGLLPWNARGGAPATRPWLVDHGRDGGPPGLVSVVAVKYTTARSLAERAVSLVAARLGRPGRPSATAWTPLPGGDVDDPDRLVEEAVAGAPPGVPPPVVRRLVEMRGTAWREPLALLAGAPALAEPLPGPAPVLRAEIVHAVREEMACTLADVLVRRTGLAAAGLPGEATIAACAALTAVELGWDAMRTGREVAGCRAALEGWREGPAFARASSTGPRR